MNILMFADCVGNDFYVVFIYQVITGFWWESKLNFSTICDSLKNRIQIPFNHRLCGDDSSVYSTSHEIKSKMSSSIDSKPFYEMKPTLKEHLVIVLIENVKSVPHLKDD